MGTKERRAREKVARRETILDAAKGVFAEKGFFATTIDEIADRAEVAKGTVYLYFKSKEEILMALLDDGVTLLAAADRSAVDRNSLYLQPRGSRWRDGQWLAAT